MPPEQQHGLTEQRCAEGGDLAGASRTVNEPDEPGGRVAALVDGQPVRVGGGRSVRGAGSVAAELDGDRRPALEQPAHRSAGRRSSPAVPVEPLEVKRPRTEPEHPAPQRARRDPDALGDARHGCVLGENPGGGIENDLDAGDLAWQRITGEHPLAVAAVAAARERHRQGQERVGRLEPALDAAPGETDVAPSARRTAAPHKKIVAGVVDDRGVAARFDGEYEDHVLMTAPGVPNLYRGRRLCGARRGREHARASSTAGFGRYNAERATPAARRDTSLEERGSRHSSVQPPNGRSSCGGARAGAIFGGATGSRRCLRMRSMDSGAVRKATISMCPPHRAHVSTSTR